MSIVIENLEGHVQSGPPSDKPHDHAAHAPAAEATPPPPFHVDDTERALRLKARRLARLHAD